jgi:hypothetical protein
LLVGGGLGNTIKHGNAETTRGRIDIKDSDSMPVLHKWGLGEGGRETITAKVGERRPVGIKPNGEKKKKLRGRGTL